MRLANNPSIVFTRVCSKLLDLISPNRSKLKSGMPRLNESDDNNLSSIFGSLLTLSLSIVFSLSITSVRGQTVSTPEQGYAQTVLPSISPGLKSQPKINIVLPPSEPICLVNPLPPTVRDLPPKRSIEELIIAALENIDQDLAPDPSLTFVVSGPEIVGSHYLFVRTYTLSGIESQIDIEEKLCIIWDPNPPELGDIPPDCTLPCGSDLPNWPKVQVTDQEWDNVVIIPLSNVIEQACGEKVKRSWTAIDGCGNVSAASQIINLTSQMPILTVPKDTIIHCSEGVPAPDYKVVEGCSKVNVGLKEIISPGIDCNYFLTRVWTAKDDCGQVVRDTQVIQVVDTIAPDIVPIGPMITNVKSGDEIVVDGDINSVLLKEEDLEITDQCCTPECIISNQLITQKLPDGTGGTCTKWKCTATVSDLCGNITEYHYFILHLNADTP